jgi:enoyl-CoA hydratase
MKEAVAVLTLNNPPANGLSPDMLMELENSIERLSNDISVRAVLIVSACEGFFSAGADVTMLQHIDDEKVAQLPRVQKIFDDLETLPVPTVAAISGHALGGGLELALACDFRFMARDAGRIGLPEVRLGLIPSFGGTQRLPQIVGRARATQMMIKGLQLTPDDAYEIGLVHDVFDASELFEKSMDYAQRLSHQATGAIARIKACISAGYREGFAEGLRTEVRCFGENIETHDAKEGVEAFLTGRKPNFTGE